MADLQQLRSLDGLIHREMKRLEELREAAGAHGVKLDGMPRAPGAKDRIGAFVPEIIDQENEITENLRQYRQRKREIEDFVKTIPDIRVRLICLLRFLDDLPWERVADRIGGRETSYSCKKAVYRFFQRLEKENGEKKAKPTDFQTV